LAFEAAHLVLEIERGAGLLAVASKAFRTIHQYAQAHGPRAQGGLKSGVISVFINDSNVLERSESHRDFEGW
jgi:hypothetical protein